jgi:hypothetical protein
MPEQFFQEVELEAERAVEEMMEETKTRAVQPMRFALMAKNAYAFEQRSSRLFAKHSTS